MLQILPVTSRRLKKKFIQFPYDLYKDDPLWVPPLKAERSDVLNEKKNPFFQNASCQLYIAMKGDNVVGRISAHINHLHNERYNEKTGFFGFFDCVNDADVAKALFHTAETWIETHGMNKVLGPMSFSTNEEVGILIEGFDTKPFIFMPHNYPYYDELIKACGYTKAKDLIAWAYDATRPVPEPAQQIADCVKEYPGLVVREVNMKNIEHDIHIIADIFNSAWSKNWGFVPWTEAELKKMAKDLKLILDPRFALIAEVNGQPAAISIALPNLNDIIFDLKGDLFPFGIFKLIYRLKTHKIKSARLCLLGIKKEFRNDILAGLSVYLYTEMHRRALPLGFKHNELSWTLEDNGKINMGIQMMGGVAYKKMRVFEKGL